LAEQQKQAEKEARLEAESARLAAEKKALDDKYASIITLADSQFTSGDYQSAKTSYTDALALKSEEAYPKSRISKIDELLVEQQKQAEEEARLAAESARLAAEKKALDEKYNDLIKLADNQFEKQDYIVAQSNYKEALNLKFSESYPKDQLRKISEILEEEKKKAEEEARLLAEQKLTDAKYYQLIAKADKYYEEEIWRSALSDYEGALKLKPEETYPKERIKVINQLLSDVKKREDEKIALRNRFNEVLEAADKMFKEEVYQLARSKYEEALDVLPKEDYPKNQIKRIDVILESLARAEEKKKELDEKYEKEINSGDDFFAKEEYSVARHHYKTAQNLKPKAKYPKGKLDEIDGLLASLKKAEAEFVANNPTNFEKKLSIIKEREYTDIIEKADKAFDSEKYTVAKVMYERALEMFDRDHPEKRLKEIEKIIRDNKVSKLSKEYKELIARADKELAQGHLSVAKFYYKKANQFGEKDNYPRKQLDKIADMLDGKKNAKVKKEYDEMIQKADAALAKKNYTVARFYYSKATKLNPKEEYPKEKLKTIETEQSKK
jgi:tetratricopeptide (TPR) repeat protein